MFKKLKVQSLLYFCKYKTLMAKLTLNIAKEIARSRGGECISESYINCQMPMFWKCAKDHLWSARLSSVKNENTWRPRCAVENRRTRTIEDMKNLELRMGQVRSG
ncbi:hypothetical protein RhiirA5_446254 [Rhizophagus irregularis]|uniref:Uncharacterized protein n=2 Tax=Rhizophagus irregularis TaxID=588596 RepID=A0A2N0NBU7_9GLOM|nr:hypothetical protein RhiirA5_446254 [Rhizophagus irregularis]